MPGIAALIVAGGSGVRAGGGLPKQYHALGGRPMICRAITAFQSHPDISLVQVVIGSGQDAVFKASTAGLSLPAPVQGGETRQDSVRHGLAALGASAPEFVLIHDAARPLVSAAAISSVTAALKNGAKAVLPLLQVPDSLRRRSEASVGEAVPREGVCRAQTPQGFRFDDIRAAHERFAGANASDDIALAERAGLSITAVSGDEMNLKVTTKADFDFAERLLAGTSETRTGMGFDVHRFVPGDHVWLCGVRVPHDHRLEGHSDADAGLHALTDAILGAMAAGDIGQHFPPTDEKWRGAPSRLFLEHAAKLVRDAGGDIVHCDITMICERPKLAPHRDTMRASIAEILHVDVARVSVKATTTEGLGFTGRGEGLTAQAIVTIRLPRP